MTCTATLSGVIISNQESAGRIQDADIGEEVSRLVVALVRRQFAAELISMLNLDSSYALKLLGG